MEDSRARRVAVAVTLAVALGTVGSCSDGGARDGTSTAVSQSPSPSPTPVRLTWRECLEEQRSEARRLSAPVARLMRAVAADDRTRAEEATAELRTSLAWRAALASACPRRGFQLDEFTQDVRRSTRRPVDADWLDVILASYSQWSRSVGEGASAGRTIRAWCAGVKEDISVTTRVAWKWTTTGKTWWVELAFDNDGPARQFAAVHGDIEASGLAPHESYDAPGPTSLTWGGSSADFPDIPHGVSTTLVAPGADQYVDTTTSGNVTLGESGVSVGVCHMTAPEVP